MSESKVAVTHVTVTVDEDGTELILEIEDARKLYSELHELFGSNYDSSRITWTGTGYTTGGAVYATPSKPYPEATGDIRAAEDTSTSGGSYRSSAISDSTPDGVISAGSIYITDSCAKSSIRAGGKGKG